MDRARVRNGRRESPDAGLVPAEDRLAVHFPESPAFVSKIQDTVVKKFRSALRMLLAQFRQPPAEFAAYYKDEIAKFTKVIADAKIPKQ